MRIEINVTDGSLELSTATLGDAEALGTKYARLELSPARGSIVNARDLRDLAAACTTVADFLERRST